MSLKALEYELHLEDVHEELFALELPRKSVVKLLNLPVVMFSYDWDNDGARMEILSYYSDVGNDDRQSVQKADENVKQFLRVLGFLYDTNLVWCMSGFNYVNDPVTINNIINSPHTVSTKNKNIIKINKFNALMSNIRTDDNDRWEVGLSAIKFLAKAHELFDHELEEEAFFSVFKSLELLSGVIYSSVYKDRVSRRINSIVPEFLSLAFDEEYKGEGNDKTATDSITNALAQLVTARRKMLMTLKYLGVELTEDDMKLLGKCVQLRNNTAGHGTTSKRKSKGSTKEEELIDADKIYFLIKITKQAIARFLFGEDHSIASLDYHKTWP